MIVFAVVFFIPQALLFAELGTAFPQEGGPYLWTRLAFGHLAGAINNFLYWVTNPVWLGGTLAFSMITAIEVFFNNGNDFSTPWFFVITLIFIWVAVLAAILSLQLGQVAAHRGRLRPVPAARLLHHRRDHLRQQARRARPVRRQLQAQRGRVRRPGRRAAVQLRRLRAAEQRR